MKKFKNLNNFMVGTLLKTAVFLFVLTFTFHSCQKESLSPPEDDTKELKNTFPKSSLPDPYVKGEEIPEIIASVDQALKSGGLEERNGGQLPFKFLGYDKSRAYRVYNDSFEITSYAFLAYTDLKDLFKVVNVVVTQKKNGKPGKPYLYEYTMQNIPGRSTPHLAKIVKYKLNGVKVDVPGGNFNPCADVICDQYNNPIGSGSGTSGSGGSGGGGTGDYSGSSGLGGTGGTGYGGYNNFVTCQSYSYTTKTGPTTYLDIVYTECTDGTSTTTYTIRYDQVFTDCCDSENVSIGVVDLNPCEKELVIQYPWAASKIFLNKDKAFEISWSTGLPGANEGCQDAFRHTLFNVLNACDVGVDIARKFSDAHECGSVSLASQMDYFNNSRGHDLARELCGKDLNFVKSYICNYLNQGNLKIISSGYLKPSNECKCQ